jgi:hypothetical protein
MKNNEIYLPNEEFDKVDKRTGELLQMRRVAKVKTLEDFYKICIATWDDFNMLSGMQAKIFRQCMKVSYMSNLSSNEGNFFFAGDAIAEIEKSFPEISATAARQHLYRLCKMGFVVKTSTRGKYSINPKYGFRGMMTEDTYAELVVKGGTMREEYQRKCEAAGEVAKITHNSNGGAE